MAHEQQFYIDGAWVEPTVPHLFDVIDPSNEDAFAQISLGTAADVDKLTQRTRDAMMNELMRLSHLRSYEDSVAVATGVDGGSETRRKVGAGL